MKNVYSFRADGLRRVIKLFIEEDDRNEEDII